MRRRAVLILVAVVVSLGGPHPAVACSCVPPSGPDYYASHAAMVFTGVVTSVSGLPFGLMCSSASPVSVTFDVETVYKGNVPRTMTVETVASGASCGYTFEAGKRYTVFPWIIDGRLDAGLCRGNVDGMIVPEDYGLPPGHPPRA